MTVENKNYEQLYLDLSESYSTLRQQYVDKLTVDGVEPYCPMLPAIRHNDTVADHRSNQERDIFIFSIINWDFRFQRPQHIAKEMSNRSRVFYVEMELSAVGISIIRKSENLYVIRLPMANTGLIDLYHGIGSNKQISGWIDSFYRCIDEVNSTSQKTVIIQHPWWWQFVKHFPPEFQIMFDCMDDISGFSNTTDEILALERSLIESCDHLVVSSEALRESTKETKESILVRNGCALEHFLGFDSESESELKLRSAKDSGKRKNVGYVGALAEWFDIDLLAEIVQLDDSIQYHICGAVTHKPILALDEFENVHFYGEISYDLVPGFISQMDVMMIPFQLTPIIQACDPVKFYEHCVMGVPTVATQMPELFRAGDNVALASDAKEFFQYIKLMIEQGIDDNLKERLIKYAHDNSWARRAGHIWEKISSYPKVSIVVLNYGRPSWSLGAIHSLCERGGNYPNLEVIVVDNGSSEEQLDELEAGLKNLSHRMEIQLIKNNENFGFAKGNNVGIARCTGEYVVLLNNDTYVSPGAIFSLVGHLKRNPEVGAVGPLTNNIGNEAKLFVNYPDISAMCREAKRWLTGYRNHNTSLKVVAYFCVAFRAKDLEEFGYLNEAYGQGMFEDDDHCNVIRKQGYDVVLAEDAFVHHHLSATFSKLEDTHRKKLFESNKKIYESRWGKWVPHVYREKRPVSEL